MSHWQNYLTGKDPTQHTVVGELLVSSGLEGPQPKFKRDLFVYLPPSYRQSGRRYPVLYMQDGQNLFDSALSYAGEWQVDETLSALAAEGIEALVVGIPNAGKNRIIEYNPFHPQTPNGAQYVDFMANTVKPLIDREFRTLPEREHTGVIGSSMGGLISLYAYFAAPQVFGMAGVVSPALWFGKGQMYDFVARAPFVPGRVYLDVGTQEVAGTGKNRHHAQAYLESVQRMAQTLLKKGYVAGENLWYVEDEGGQHNETDWARRLPDMLRFLFTGLSR